MTKKPGKQQHGEYEPTDSRNVTHPLPDGESWRDKEGPGQHHGEYEPKDSRNVTRPGTEAPPKPSRKT